MFSILLMPIFKIINNIVVGQILGFFFMVLILSWPFMSFFYILNYYICTQFPVLNVLMLDLSLNVYEFQKYVYCLGILDSSWFCFMILIIAYSFHLILNQLHWTIRKNYFYFSQNVVSVCVIFVFFVYYFVEKNISYDFGYLTTILKSFHLKGFNWKNWNDISQLQFYNELIRDNFLFLHPYLLMAFLCIVVGLFSILRTTICFRDILSIFNMQLLLKKLYLVMFILGFTATFYGALWAYYDFNWNGWWIWDSIEIWMYFLILYNLIFIHTTFISTMKTQVGRLLLTCHNFRQTRVVVQLLSLLQKYTNISFFLTAILFILFIKLNLFSSIHNFVLPNDYFGKVFLIYKTVLALEEPLINNNILLKQVVATFWLIFVFFSLLALWTVLKNNWQYCYKYVKMSASQIILRNVPIENLIAYYLPLVAYSLTISFVVFFFYLLKIPFHNLFFKDFFVFSFFGLNYACNLAFVILIIILSLLKLNLSTTKQGFYIILTLGFLFFLTNYGNYELWLLNFIIILFFYYVLLNHVFQNIYTSVAGNYSYFKYPFFSKVNHYFKTHSVLLLWMWFILTSKVIVSIGPTYLNFFSSSDISVGSFILTELRSFQFSTKLDYPFVYTNCLSELNTSLFRGNIKLLLHSSMNSYSWIRIELIDIYKQFKVNNLNQTIFCLFSHEYLIPNSKLNPTATTTNLVTNGVLFRFDFFSYLGAKTEIFSWKYPTNLIILFLWFWYIYKLTKKLINTTFIQSDI